MREVIVYSRRGCHLCELLIDEVEPLVRGRAVVTVRDVDTHPEWANAFGSDVPVVLVDGFEVCRHRLDRQALLSALAAAV